MLLLHSDRLHRVPAGLGVHGAILAHTYCSWLSMSVRFTEPMPSLNDIRNCGVEKTAQRRSRACIE